MPGAIAILVVLLIFPILAIVGTTVVAIGLGWSLNKDGEERFEGSELLDINV